MQSLVTNSPDAAATNDETILRYVLVIVKQMFQND